MLSGYPTGLLLSLVVSEVSIHAYRVSQVKRKIMKLFHGILKEEDTAQFRKCNWSGQAGEPHDALNGTIDRDKGANRVCFLIQERMSQGEYPAQGNTA